VAAGSAVSVRISLALTQFSRFVATQQLQQTITEYLLFAESTPAVMDAQIFHSLELSVTFAGGWWRTSHKNRPYKLCTDI
jgi:hypothetical protein